MQVNKRLLLIGSVAAVLQDDAAIRHVDQHGQGIAQRDERQ